MSKYVIIPDSNADVSKELQKRFNIVECGTSTVSFPDGSNYQTDGSWDFMQPEEFYSFLRKNPNVTTAAHGPEYYESLYEKYLMIGKDVLSIILTSALSSTYNHALEAANKLMKKYPERKVLVLDSLKYSASELVLVIEALKCQKDNMSIDETYQHLLKLRHCVHQAGPMDDLKFLAGKGRISNGKAFMGTIIGVNPIGEVTRDGITKVLCKVKGGKKALKVSLEYIKRTIVNPNEATIVIAHSNRKEKALLYKEMIEKEINPKEVILTVIGSACAPNIGPGLCAAYYIGKEISEGLVEESKIFNDILNNK